MKLQWLLPLLALELGHIEQCLEGKRGPLTSLLGLVFEGIINIRSISEKSSLNRRMCIRFENRTICVAGNQCDDSDFDFHNVEHTRSCLR